MPEMTYQDRSRHNEAWAMRRKFMLRVKQVAQDKAYDKGAAKWKMYLYAVCYGIGWEKLCTLSKEKMYGN